VRLLSLTALLLAAGVSRPGCGGTPTELPPPCILAPNTCSGKPCGAACTRGGGCGGAPTFAGQCDASGECIPSSGTPLDCPPPVESCLGQRCGTACQYPCPPEGCPSPAVVAACNGNQSCETPLPWDTCYDPCAGKACGATCKVCPPGAPCAETTELKECDAHGRCVSWTDTSACPG
jgi:hypothetical protein